MIFRKRWLGWIGLALFIGLGSWYVGTVQKDQVVTAYLPDAPQDKTQEPLSEVRITEEHERARTALSAPSIETQIGITGKLEVVDPVNATGWNGEISINSADQEMMVIPVENGIATAPLGSWKIQTSDEWNFEPDSVVITEGKNVLVYAIQKKLLKFIVYDEELTPIEGVIARFHPASLDRTDTLPSQTGVSGADGRLQFQEPCVAVGRMLFEKAGYQPFEQRISGFLADEITIILSRDDYRRVRFVAYDDMDLPLEGVSVSTFDGSYKMGVSDEQGELLLGATTMDAQDSLLLTGGCFPSFLILEQSDSMINLGAIPVPRISRGTVGLIGTKANSAFFEVIGSDSAQTGAVPFNSQQVLSNGAEWQIAMPRGMKTSIAVWTDDGECGTALFEAGPDGWRTQIILDRSDVLEIVPLLDNRTTHGVRATVMYTGRSILVSPESGSAMEFEVPEQELMDVDGILRIPFCSRVAVMWLDVPGAERVILAPYGTASRAGVLRLDLMPTVSASFQVFSNGDPLTGIGIQLDSRRTGMNEHPDRSGGWPTSHPSWTIRRPPSCVRPANSKGLVTFDVSPGPYQASLRDTPGYWPLETLYSLERPVWSGQLTRDSLIRLEAPSPRLVSIEVWNGPSNQPAKRFDLYAHGERLLSNDGCYWEGRLPDYVTYLNILIPDVGQATVHLNEKAVQQHIVSVLPSGSIPVVVKGWQELDIARGRIRVSFMLDENGKGDEFLSDAFIVIDSMGNGGIIPPEWPAGTIHFDPIEQEGRVIEFEPTEVPWPTSTIRLTCHLREEQP